MPDAQSRPPSAATRRTTVVGRRGPGLLPTALRAALRAALLGLGACAPQRILTVESYPPGAIVRLDEQVIGRTPLDHRFEHYGKRRITLYLPGYRTWSRRLELIPPWHARFPVDIVTELLVPIGLRDLHEVWVVLENDEVVGGHPDLGPLLERAKEMRARGTQITPPAEPEAEPEAAGGEPADAPADEGESELPQAAPAPEAPPEAGATPPEAAATPPGPAPTRPGATA